MGKIGLIISVVANIALLVWGYMLYKGKGEAELDVSRAKAQIETLNAQHKDETAALESTFQQEIQAINEEWTTKLSAADQAHQEKIARIYTQINEVMYESDETLKYIGTLENKLQSGQKLAQEEVETLQMIAGGLTYLHDQYQKPIGEFRELERYLASQMEVAPMPPKEKNKFLARVFSKKYREEERAYYREVGSWEAFENARQQVSAAYGRAQKQMASISVSYDKYMNDLQAVITSEEADAAQLQQFFDESRKVLNIHNEIMKLQDEQPVPPSDPPVNP